MKKIFLIVSVIILLGFVQNVQATSGACSYHSGVNCGAGPDWDGSAICNDGWRDSTVSYLSSKECENYIYCTDAELSTIYAKYGIDNLQSQKSSLEAKIALINVELNAALIKVEGKPMTMSSIIGQKNRLISDANMELAPLQSQLNLVNSQLTTALTSALGECKALGVARINKLRQLAYQIYLDSLAQKQAIQEQELIKQLQITCSTNSTLKDDGKCYCNSGYWYSDKKSSCIKYDEWCKLETPNTYYNEDACHCKSGYLYDSKLSKCYIPTVPSNTSKTETKPSVIGQNYIFDGKKTVVRTTTKISIKSKVKASEVINSTSSVKAGEKVVTTTTEKTTQPKMISEEMKSSLKDRGTKLIKDVMYNVKKSIQDTGKSIGNFFKKLKFW